MDKEYALDFGNKKAMKTKRDLCLGYWMKVMPRKVDRVVAVLMPRKVDEIEPVLMPRKVDAGLNNIGICASENGWN